MLPQDDQSDLNKNILRYFLRIKVILLTFIDVRDCKQKAANRSTEGTSDKQTLDQTRTKNF